MVVFRVGFCGFFSGVGDVDGGGTQREKSYERKRSRAFRSAALFVLASLSEQVAMTSQCRGNVSGRPNKPASDVTEVGQTVPYLKGGW